MENFYDIKSGTKGKRYSFEELSCQIFRRELATTSNAFQRYRGDGGDGGVEAVFINEDLSEIGLQSKYWENNSFGYSEITQLTNSLEAAVKNHPNLNVYYISIPFNLTGTVAEGKRGKSQTDKFEEWRIKSESAYSLKIILWNSTVLFDLLHKHDKSGGIFKYWFDNNCLSIEQYEKYKEEVIAQAGRRYTPELNVNVPVYNILNYFSEKELLENDFKTILETLSKYQRNIIFKDNEKELFSKVNETIDYLIQSFNSLIYKKNNKLLLPISNSIDTILKIAREKEEYAFSDLKKKYGNKFHDGPQFRQFMAEYMCALPCALLDEIRDLEKDLEDIKEFVNSQNLQAYFSKTMIITGTAGIGKTHSIIDYMRKNILNTDFVFYGEDFSVQEPWIIIRDKLGLPSIVSKEELFQILSINAETKQTIGIIFIDAINESSDLSKWHSWLPVLIKDISYYDNLKLCISCRDTFLGEFEEEFFKYLIIKHNGFVGNEYLAISSFCDYYKLIPPSYPIFNTEFCNPLFLHLLCETVSDNQNKTFPKDQLGLLNVFQNFIRIKNKKISKICDIDEEDNLLEEVFKYVTNKMMEEKRRYLSYSDFKQIITSIHSSVSFSRSLVNVLEKESIITRIKVRNELKIRFSYDRLTDFYIANYLINDSYKDYLLDEKFCEENPSLVEMLAIIIPEKNDTEILEILDNDVLANAFINSLPWRSMESITYGTSIYVRKLMSLQKFAQELMNKILLLSAIPNNLLNADFIDDLFKEITMCDRDRFFTYYLMEDYDNCGSAYQLIKRACFSSFDCFSEDSLFLWAKILCWFCTASDRKVRDQSSKGLIRILQYQPSLCINLFDNFKDIDDEYILERLFQAVYSSFLLNNNFKDIECFANYIIKNNLLEKYSNIFLHDFLRLIIEMAKKNNTNYLPDEIYLKIINSSIKSNFEKVDEDIYNQLIQEEEFKGQDINFVNHWYTDFQRYILCKAIDIFDLEAANITIDDIYKWFVVNLKKLGYPGSRKGVFNFDKYLVATYGGGRGKPIEKERLSKKYYWILLHQIIGLLQNTCPLKPIIFYDEKESLLPRLLSLKLRDIDLTDLRYLNNKKYPELLVPNFKINNNVDLKDWITDDNDYYDENKLFSEIIDFENTIWIPINYLQDNKITLGCDEYPYKRSCILLSSSFVPNSDYKKMNDTVKKELANGNVYEYIPHDYNLFLGEVPDSRSYAEYKERNIISEKEYRDDIFTLIPSSLEMSRGKEWEYDCSFDSNNILFPSSFIIKKLKLTWDRNSGWINDNGKLIAFSQEINGHICLFIKKEEISKLLLQDDYKLIFRIYKEKIYVPNLRFTSSLHSKRIIFSFDGVSFSTIINYDDINDYREVEEE